METYRRGRKRAHVKGKYARLPDALLRAATIPEENVWPETNGNTAPSITGMAAGFSIVDDLNAGDVVGKALGGNLSQAINGLSANAQNLIKTDAGRKSLVQAVGIAAIGAWARKALPATKIGGTKLYFRI